MTQPVSCPKCNYTLVATQDLANVRCMRCDYEWRVSPTAAWLPIDTAPKEGTHILGFKDGQCAVVKWRDGINKFWELAIAGTYPEDTEWNPTHWMPLPAPPEAK